MNMLLTLVIYMALLAWFTIMAASVIRSKGWTPAGVRVGCGNRDTLPEPTPLSGRAERTARNTLENFVLFAAIALVAQASGNDTPPVTRGAELFFWARVVYVPVYYAGIVYLRTLVWLAGIVGLAIMVCGVL